MKAERNDTFILIAVFDDRAYKNVYRQLLDCGFEEEQLMNSKSFTEKLPISYLEQNQEKYKKAYSLLEDEDSKEIYLSMPSAVLCNRSINTLDEVRREQKKCCKSDKIV